MLNIPVEFMPEEWRSRQDYWFAWYPVRFGALGTGRLVWLKTVWRNRCMGATIYQRKLKEIC
jgi:hypothetical protein